jgi:methylene-fatty-acyl-phospholipid synthase
VNLWLLLAAAALLSLERLCYVWIWRAPDAFREWCLRARVTRAFDPIEVLAALFSFFKGLQVAVFFAWCYVHDGTLRAVTTDDGVLAAGAGLVLMGQALNVSVFSRLGKAGVFYGNKLGHDVPWCRTFPFTWFKHPQYVGAVLSIWGFFVFMRFPADDWFVLPVLETMYYVVGTHFEQDRPEEVEAT